MPNSSKNKGSGFEREIAKWLTDKLETPMTRTAGSGAWFGGKNRSRQASAEVIHDRKGDIAGIPGLVIECKRYRDMPDLADGPNGTFDGWLKQLMHDCDPSDFPLLIWKLDRRPVMCASPSTWLTLPNHIPHGVYIREPSDQGMRWITCRLDKAIDTIRNSLERR